MFAFLEGERDDASVGLDEVLVDLRLQVAGEAVPAVPGACHREEDLSRIQAATVIVGVKQPHGYLVLAAGLHLAGLGVVVVESAHIDLPLADVVASANLVKYDVRLAD